MFYVNVPTERLQKFVQDLGREYGYEIANNSDKKFYLRHPTIFFDSSNKKIYYDVGPEEEKGYKLVTIEALENCLRKSYCTKVGCHSITVFSDRIVGPDWKLSFGEVEQIYKKMVEFQNEKT